MLSTNDMLSDKKSCGRCLPCLQHANRRMLFTAARASNTSMSSECFQPPASVRRQRLSRNPAAGTSSKFGSTCHCSDIFVGSSASVGHQSPLASRTRPAAVSADERAWVARSQRNLDLSGVRPARSTVSLGHRATCTP